MASQSDLVEKTGQGIRIKNDKGQSLDLTMDEARRIQSQVQQHTGGSSGSSGSGSGSSGSGRDRSS